MTISLKFGIDPLDQFFQQPDDDSPNQKNWTGVIMGPDGCGKSLLALHMAAEYWRSHRGPKPFVIYVSTDFSHGQANQAWAQFGLGNPAERLDVLKWMREEFTSEKEQYDRIEEARTHLGNPPNAGALFGHPPKLELKQIKPVTEDLQKMVLTTAPGNRVFFIDLQTQTAGDDWTFLNQVLGMLPADRNNNPKPLVIVDAVEGLETFVGERDAYGERRTRRSRIAQTVRSAARAEAHIVFVIEPVTLTKRLPEQFIADIVIRLRLSQDRDYAVRTVEIEKCRGGSHVRGEHEYSIRNGYGSSTGIHLHVDDPRMLRSDAYDIEKFHKNDPDESENVRKCLLSYIHVIPSLHRWNRNIQQANVHVPDQEGTNQGTPNFGLARLDDLIGYKRSEADSDMEHPGSLTILLGDAGTHKSRLARSFLSQTFLPRGKYQAEGVAVLISTGLMDGDKLCSRLNAHLDDNLTPEQTKRILCRRLNVKHLSSASFLEIVERHIRAAQHQLRRWLLSSQTGLKLKDIRSKDRALSPIIDVKRWGGLIRIVIDDWNVIQATHPNIAEDPLLLQSLVSLLKMQNVTALIVSTQPGQPILPATQLAPQDLRKIDERHVYTWSVSFFGQRCTAVTADRGQAAPLLSMVYELKPWPLPVGVEAIEKNKSERETFLAADARQNLQKSSRLKKRFLEGNREGLERALRRKRLADGLRTEIEAAIEFLKTASFRPLEKLTVDPEFALYAGIEEAAPRRIPLVLRLYGGPHTTEQGAKTEPHFQRMLRQTFQQIFPTSPLSSVVTFESFATYDDFFSFADLLDDSRLEHTLIFQVDEFWTAERKSLANLKEYWERAVATPPPQNDKASSWDSIKEEDVYGMLQPHPESIGLTEDGKQHLPFAPTITNMYNSQKTIEFSPINGKGFYSEKVSLNSNVCRKQLFARAGHPYRDIDRIPFLWDFGLIVARRELWERCKDEDISYQTIHKVKIGDVWNSLCLAKDRLRSDLNGKEYDSHLEIGWSDFLDACRLIARENPGTVTFDVDLHTAESPSCLLLEMWASYAFHDDDDPKNPDTAVWRHGTSDGDKEKERFVQLTFRDDVDTGVDGPTLRALATIHRRSLFAACVQHVSACSHLEAVDRTLVRREGSSDFVASRQWYSTASALFGNTTHTDLCLLSLPGKYSTRGDWFLAMANGSRSYLLGQRAFDLLSGRKLSLLRLQDGLGLPCRDILPDAQIDELKSAIWRHNISTGRREKLTYGEICQLGARNIVQEGDEGITETTEPEPSESNRSPRTLNWLWRSRIEKYDRDCFYLRRWIARIYDDRAQWLLPKIADAPSKLLSSVSLMKLDDKVRVEPNRKSKNAESADEGIDTLEPYSRFLKHLDVLISALR